MFEGKDESACMRGKSRSHSPTFHQVWRGGGKQLQRHLHDVPLSCSASSFHLGCPSLEFFARLPYVPASFFSIGLPTYLADGCQCLDWRELERWIAPWPLPRNPRPDYPPPVSTSFPRWILIPNSFSPSLRLLQLYPSHGRTDKRGASSNIDGNDALILPCLPLPRAPHRIVNVATRLRRGRPNICLFRRPWGNPSLP